jgi:hypothetical protein
LPFFLREVVVLRAGVRLARVVVLLATRIAPDEARLPL